MSMLDTVVRYFDEGVLSQLRVLFPQVADIFMYLFPYVLLYTVIATTWKSWVKWRRLKAMTEIDWVCIQIRLPQETFKTPKAMEIVLTAIHQAGGEGTWIDRNIKGTLRPSFSLEMASHGGEVQFYMYVPKKLKNNIEVQIYSQFPDIEINEVPDYTASVPFSIHEHDLEGYTLKLSKADPLPIKTYIDYGMDKPGTEEEEKIDPLTVLIESLGALKSGEHAWVQMVVRSLGKKKVWGGWTSFWEKKAKEGKTWGQILSGDFWKMIWKEEDPFKDATKKALEDLKTAGILKLKVKDEDKDFGYSPTKFQQETIEALERAVNKFAFEVGIRVVYIAEKSKFKNKGLVGPGMWKQFNSVNLNGFAKDTDVSAGKWYWPDFKNVQSNGNKLGMYEAYRLRSWYEKIERHEGTMVLTTEELATIYHFPGSVARTPTFTRIPSKKSTAPANLPI